MGYKGGQLFIKTIEVSGFVGAIHGMRNPLNSWFKADSKVENGQFIMGENDMKLATTLIKGGAEHRKFLRMIQVQFDLNLPRYVWSEFDTYKFNTKNSCSTMHKLFNKDDENENRVMTELDELLSTRGDLSLDNFFYHEEDERELQQMIDKLNSLKVEYYQATPSEKKHLLRRAKQLLPEGLLQMRTVSTNYEELMNIYHQRKNHRLDIEWTMICDYILELPHMKDFMEVTK